MGFHAVVMEWIETVQTVYTMVIEFLPRLGAALAIFLAFWFAARLLRGGVQRFGRTRRLSPDVVNLMIQITEAGLMIFGVVTALGTLGINVGAMIAGLGLVGFALGFALKDLLSNFLSGFLILIYTPFIRGDWISTGGNEGSVVEINMRYTVLEHEGKRILIPNSKLFMDPVIVTRKTAETIPGSDYGPQL